MIHNLIIRNVQSHKETILDFHPGVNVIIGATDSGKTGILRALKFIHRNRPSGDSLRSWWGGKMEVIETTSENVITRSKDKIEEYRIDSIKDPFHAFGVTVPVEIQEALNMDEVNLQSQLDSPFLLSNTPGEVASYFNKVANLETIDTGLKNVESAIREMNSTKGKKGENGKPSTGLIKFIEDQEAELKKYQHLQKFEIDLEVLEGMIGELQGKKSKISDLKTLLSNIVETMNDLEAVQGIIEIELLVNPILENMEAKKQLTLQSIQLSRDIKAITSMNEELSEITGLLELESATNDLLSMISIQNNLRLNRGKLIQLVSAVKSTEGDYHQKINEIEALKEEFAEEFPDTCPLCGTYLGGISGDLEGLHKHFED